MNPIASNQLYDFGKVNTLHILKSGEVIASLQEYLKVEERFSWVNRSYVISKLLQLRKLTDAHRKSLIVMYEDGQLIREFINVEESFTPLAFC